MGRKKITIKKIADPRNRVVTFNKRKSGLIKKTMELSLLCDAKICLIINCEGKIMQYCSDEIDKFLLDFSEAGETDEQYDNSDYTKMFENGGTGPAPTQLNINGDSKRSSSTKTPDDVLRKLKEDIDMKARIEKQQQAILMMQRQQQQQRMLQIQAQGGNLNDSNMNPMSMTTAGYSNLGHSQMPNILSMPMDGAGGGLGLRNNPRMYQISSSAEVVKNMDRKEISNIAEQLVRNSSDNPFADLPQINVTIAKDSKSEDKSSTKSNSESSNKSNNSNNEKNTATTTTNVAALGLGLPGLKSETVTNDTTTTSTTTTDGEKECSNNDDDEEQQNGSNNAKRKDMEPPASLRSSKRLRKTNNGVLL